MTENPLIKKLQIKPGQRIIILNAPPDYLETLEPLPQGIEQTEKLSGSFDFIHFFAANTSELARYIPSVLSSLKENGILWISYPKKTGKIENREYFSFDCLELLCYFFISFKCFK